MIIESISSRDLRVKLCENWWCVLNVSTSRALHVAAFENEAESETK